MCSALCCSTVSLCMCLCYHFDSMSSINRIFIQINYLERRWVWEWDHVECERKREQRKQIFQSNHVRSLWAHNFIFGVVNVYLPNVRCGPVTKFQTNFHSPFFVMHLSLFPLFSIVLTHNNRTIAHIRADTKIFVTIVDVVSFLWQRSLQLIPFANLLRLAFSA